MLRKVIIFLFILISFILQCSVFGSLAFAGIIPNLMVILTSSFGFMRGEKEGLVIGFFCGLLTDIFFGNFLGFYALVLMYIGYLNGKFSRIFYPEDIKLPMILISASDIFCNLLIYFSRFFLRSRFAFRYYFIHIIAPEWVYTILVTVFLYFILLMINQRLEKSEKRRTGKVA